VKDKAVMLQYVLFANTTDLSEVRCGFCGEVHEAMKLQAWI
jgi:hypothetical protein